MVHFFDGHILKMPLVFGVVSRVIDSVPVNIAWSFYGYKLWVTFNSKKFRTFFMKGSIPVTDFIIGVRYIVSNLELYLANLLTNVLHVGQRSRINPIICDAVPFNKINPINDCLTS